MIGRLKRAKQRYLGRLRQAVFASRIRLRARARLARSKILGEDPGIIPQTFFSSTAAWLETRAGRRSGTSFAITHPETSLRIPAPNTAGPAGADIRKHGIDRLPMLFVVGIPGAVVSGDTGDVVTPDGCVLADLSLMHADSVFGTVGDRHAIFDKDFRGKADRLPGRSVLLTSQWGHDNYFHWLLNLMPRFELYRLAGVDWRTADHLIVSGVSEPFQHESLKAVDAPLDRLVISGEGFLSQSDVLYATRSLRACGHACEWAHSFVRSLFLKDDSDRRGPKPGFIFVSRADARKRRLLNEDECFGRLEDLGFVRVAMSGKSIAEQATLFAGARMIVGSHGAALTNLVFASKGAIVLELFPPGRPRAYFWELSCVRGLRYGYLTGTADGEEGDFVIDGSVLRDIVEQEMVALNLG